MAEKAKTETSLELLRSENRNLKDALKFAIENTSALRSILKIAREEQDSYYKQLYEG